MKRIALYVSIMLLFAGPLYAAATGSCAVSNDVSGNIQTATWSCTADGSGTFLATGFASSATQGWVYAVDVYPGGTAPNAGSLTLITSDTGADALGGNGASSLGSTVTRMVPAKSGWVHGTLQPVITGNSTGSATFTIKVMIWRQQ